jgi:hypothetical protein
MACPGDNLTLYCCTNDSALQWTINISHIPLRFSPGEDGIRLIYLQSPEIERPITANLTTINFFKASSSPLVSVLTIDNVTTNWNQTKIKCARRIEEMILTTIHIIDHSKIHMPLYSYAGLGRTLTVIQAVSMPDHYSILYSLLILSA